MKRRFEHHINALYAKAGEIARGRYDKDIDYVLRDRVLWAACLYSAADKLEDGKLTKLTQQEVMEIGDLGNYAANCPPAETIALHKGLRGVK